MGIYEEMKKVEESSLGSITANFSKIENNSESYKTNLQLKNVSSGQVRDLIFHLMDVIVENNDMKAEEAVALVMFEYGLYRLKKDN